jgi:hypothetical protein
LGRLAAFTNQKPARRTPGRYAPWVKLVRTVWAWRRAPRRSVGRQALVVVQRGRFLPRYRAYPYHLPGGTGPSQADPAGRIHSLLRGLLPDGKGLWFNGSEPSHGSRYYLSAWSFPYRDSSRPRVACTAARWPDTFTISRSSATD